MLAHTGIQVGLDAAVERVQIAVPAGEDACGWSMLLRNRRGHSRWKVEWVEPWLQAANIVVSEFAGHKRQTQPLVIAPLPLHGLPPAAPHPWARR